MNCYIRIRLALTEDKPTIRPYEENSWPALPDAESGPIDVSLDLLDALHRRWTPLLRGLSPDDCQRAYDHPEIDIVSIDESIANYAWHGRHHPAHITALRQRMDW